jgi:bifunctional DNase/RNase
MVVKEARGKEAAMVTATDVDFIEMRIGKVVALKSDDHWVGCIVLDEVIGSRHLLIQIGQAEAFSLAASLQGVQWGRPMTYQFVAALLAGLGGRVRQVRIDRLVAGAYAATVEVEGPLGVKLIDARSSDALNLAALVDPAIFVAPEVLQDCETRCEGDSAEATELRRALTAGPMTIKRQET